MNPPPVGAWRGSDDNGYISGEPSPGVYHMVRQIPFIAPCFYKVNHILSFEV